MIMLFFTQFTVVPRSNRNKISRMIDDHTRKPTVQIYLKKSKAFMFSHI